MTARPVEPAAAQSAATLLCRTVPASACSPSAHAFHLSTNLPFLALLPACLQLLYDGSDPEAVRLLGTLRHVTLMHIHPPFASAVEQAKLELYDQGASEASSRQWAGQPGNFQLMVKQG